MWKNMLIWQLFRFFKKTCNIFCKIRIKSVTLRLLNLNKPSSIALSNLIVHGVDD